MSDEPIVPLGFILKDEQQKDLTERRFQPGRLVTATVRFMEDGLVYEVELTAQPGALLRQTYPPSDRDLDFARAFREALKVVPR